MSPDPPEKPKRRAGRQPKTTPKQVRVVSVRLTETEYQALATEAQDYRKSLGEILRAVWVGTPDVARPPHPRTVEEVVQLRQLVQSAHSCSPGTAGRVVPRPR